MECGRKVGILPVRDSGSGRLRCKEGEKSEMNSLSLDDMFQPQMLHQQNDVDCGLEVFRALLNLTRAEIVGDLPGVAKRETSADDWMAYAKTKGQELKIYQPGEEHPLPCALLVGDPPHCHWVYQATDGGIHDPSPVSRSVPPKMITLAYYPRHVLTVAVKTQGR